MQSRVLASLLVALPLVGCGPAPEPPAETAPAAEPAALRTIELPGDVAFPEGIAYDASANALYTASAENGAVVRVDAASGAGEVIVAPATLLPADNTVFPGPLGMTLDGSHLWIGGGFTGKVWVVDTTDGSVVKEATVPTAPKSLINDVTIAGGSAYLTDTFVPTLWRMSIDGDTIGDPEPWLDLGGSAIEYGDGPNLNGITSTSDGQTLIVVQMNKGLLFRIDVASKAITPIDTGGADLTTADGLVLDGDMLYVVRQGAGEVAAVRLSDDLSTGTVVARHTEGLAWPATAAKVGDDLVVVNTQFDTRGSEPSTTERPFTLVRIPTSRLAAQ